jgi:hypothetical protein
MAAYTPAAHHPRQEYLINRRGQRQPCHTPIIGRACICTGCHQRRWWTPDRRAARGRQIRAWLADGTIPTPRPNVNLRRASHWKPEQYDYLRSLVGKHDISTIAAKVSERFGVPRSEMAIKRALQRIDVRRLDERPYTTGEVARMLGISRQTVLARLVDNGLLASELWRGGHHGMRVYSRASLEALIREHPEAYDADRIREPGLKALARAISRGRRLLGSMEVERVTGVDHRTLVRWYAAGMVPSARRVRGVTVGRGGAWLIAAADVETVRRLRIDLPAEYARRRAERPRDPATGRLLAVAG